MLIELSTLERLKNIKIKNEIKIKEKNRLRNRLDSLYTELENLKDKYEDLSFLSTSLSEYYKIARESNLSELSKIVGETMTYILGKPYDVDINIKKQGQYDYLDINVNGVPQKDLSGGEKQVLSLLLVAESVTNEVLILDETINSLDPYTQETVLTYLKDLSEDYQIIMIELDDNLNIQYDYIVEEGGVKIVE